MSKSVLIVDDQPGIRLLLKEIISSEGYQVIEAINGKEALDKITLQVPDLLLVDYRLPVMDGYTLLKHLEEKKINVITIMMSGLQDEAIEKTKDIDMVEEVFAKPFNVDDIRNMVNRILK